MRICTCMCEWTNLEPERGYKEESKVEYWLYGLPAPAYGREGWQVYSGSSWLVNPQGWKGGGQNFGNIWRHFCISDKSLL